MEGKKGEGGREGERKAGWKKERRKGLKDGRGRKEREREGGTKSQKYYRTSL